MKKTNKPNRRWWCTPLIPVFRRQRQVDLYELEASLVYRVSSRTARVTQRNPVSRRGLRRSKSRSEKRKSKRNCCRIQVSHGWMASRWGADNFLLMPFSPSPFLSHFNHGFLVILASRKAPHLAWCPGRWRTQLCLFHPTAQPWGNWKRTFRGKPLDL